MGCVAFGLVRRAAIRPGALTLLTLEELSNPIRIGDHSCILRNHSQKVSKSNDGLVNFPSDCYEGLCHYVLKWRSKSYCNKEHVLLKLNSDNALESQDLGTICSDLFKMFHNKSFCFTDYRQHLQTTFCQTTNNETDIKWFNRVMEHR